MAIVFGLYFKLVDVTFLHIFIQTDCMKFTCIFLSLFFLGTVANAQSGFQFETNKNRVVIPFKLINNLVFIPINVNGAELNFLLDTGVEETILLSLDEKEAVNFFNVKKIKLCSWKYS